MEYAAIRHEADKRYCFAIEKGKFLIRIQTKKDDMEKVILHTRDKYIPLELLDTRAECEMKKVSSDRYFDYFESVIEIDVVCLRYYFELIDKEGKTSYFGNCEFYDGEISHIDFMFDCPQNLREEEVFDIPKWARNKVVYQIFPSRFATSKDVLPRRWYKVPITAKDDLKGDLRGIINHFDHLLELGVDIIYMTPIFKSDSTHKYDTNDYYQIDPSFGTEDDLRELVDLAHSHGMKVILDAVFNHTSTKFFAFDDVAKKGESSKYWDWYYIQGYPLKAERYKRPNYKTFSYFGGMPKLNLQNEEVAEYVINVAKYWIEKCNIDGWRLDVADEVSHSFWKKFRKEVRKVKKEALIIGEVWHFAGDFLEGDEWDTVMNYDFFFATQRLVAQESYTVSQFMERMGRLQGNLHRDVYPVLWNLIDSHDTARFLHVCGENKEKLRMAAALQLLMPGMPFIYYGDEYAMTGANDPDCRRGMLWDEKRQDAAMFAWYQKLIRIRKAYPSITEGTVMGQYCDDENAILRIEKELLGESGLETAEIIFYMKEHAVELRVCREGKVLCEGRI